MPDDQSSTRWKKQLLCKSIPVLCFAISSVISHRIKLHNRCFNTSDKIGYSALVFNNIIIYINGLSDIGWKSCLRNIVLLCAFFNACLTLFLLHDFHPPIYLTFCTVLHSATCDSAKGESRMMIQSVIHCRSRAHKGSTDAPTYNSTKQCSKWIRHRL